MNDIFLLLLLFFTWLFEVVKLIIITFSIIAALYIVFIDKIIFSSMVVQWLKKIIMTIPKIASIFLQESMKVTIICIIMDGQNINNFIQFLFCFTSVKLRIQKNNSQTHCNYGSFEYHLFVLSECF